MARMETTKNACSIPAVKSPGKYPLARLRKTSEDNIKVDPIEVHRLGGWVPVKSG
jgi:hypothetical protein